MHTVCRDGVQSCVDGVTPADNGPHPGNSTQPYEGSVTAGQQQQRNHSYGHLLRLTGPTAYLGSHRCCCSPLQAQAQPRNCHQVADDVDCHSQHHSQGWSPAVLQGTKDSVAVQQGVSGGLGSRYSACSSLFL